MNKNEWREVDCVSSTVAALAAAGSADGNNNKKQGADVDINSRHEEKPKFAGAEGTDDDAANVEQTDRYFGGRAEYEAEHDDDTDEEPTNPYWGGRGEHAEDEDDDDDEEEANEDDEQATDIKQTPPASVPHDVHA